MKRKVFFIYAENCRHCLQALSFVIEQSKEKDFEVVKLNFDQPAALNLAINYNLDDLPGFVCGDDTCKGKGCSIDRIKIMIDKFIGKRDNK